MPTQSKATSRASHPTQIKPFAGKVFYLDLPSNRQAEALENDIKQLGGVRCNPTCPSWCQTDIFYILVLFLLSCWLGYDYVWGCNNLQKYSSHNYILWHFFAWLLFPGYQGTIIAPLPGGQQSLAIFLPKSVTRMPICLHGNVLSTLPLSLSLSLRLLRSSSVRKSSI